MVSGRPLRTNIDSWCCGGCAGEQLGWLLVSVSTAAPASTRRDGVAATARTGRGLPAAVGEPAARSAGDAAELWTSCSSGSVPRVAPPDYCTSDSPTRTSNGRWSRTFSRPPTANTTTCWGGCRASWPSWSPSEPAGGPASSGRGERGRSGPLPQLARQDRGARLLRRPARRAGPAALERCATELEAFEQEAFAAEDTPLSDSPAAPLASSLAAAARPDTPLADPAGRP